LFFCLDAKEPKNQRFSDENDHGFLLKACRNDKNTEIVIPAGNAGI
jgi:hypothetical protein